MSAAPVPASYRQALEILAPVTRWPVDDPRTLAAGQAALEAIGLEPAPTAVGNLLRAGFVPEALAVLRGVLR
jgi:hypothetical protein